jgi:hypothetical protein
MMLGGGRTVIFDIAAVNDLRVSPTTATGRVFFVSDGTITYTGNGAGGSASWTIPAPARGIGANYWIKLVVNTGAAPTIGDVAGSVLSLSVNRSWGWTASAGQSRIANCTISIYSDAGGTNLLASDTFTVDVEST